MFKLTKRMRDKGNAPYEHAANARLAAQIRAFRPEPVSNLSDKKLVWIVGRSRDAARRFGVADPSVIKHWVMIDALLAPCFFAAPEVAEHFQAAFGDPDTKARDLIQIVKVTLRDNGRAAEIWW